MRMLSLALGLTLGLGCDHSQTPGGVGDGGPGGADSDPPGGKPKITWPDPVLTIEGARSAHLVKSPDGVLTLVYRKDGKVWALRNPPGGTAVELGAVSGVSDDLSVVASPDADRFFVAWAGRWGAVVSGGQPEGPRFELYGGSTDLSNIGTAWFGGMPAVTAYTAEVWVGSETIPASFIGFSVPTSNPTSMPEPGDRVLQKAMNTYHHFNETHSLLPLSQNKALVFYTGWWNDPADPTGQKPMAKWLHVAQDPTASGAAAYYLVPVKTGLMELPERAGWIQTQQLEPGKLALTWGTTVNSMVYDVFIAGLAMDADGIPSLTTQAVNVSMTTGATQNSDHAIVRPTGDGRYWIAWRETDHGPRVALLDGKDFHVLALGGPEAELSCNMETAMGAQVDEQGTLHLAAGFHDGTLRVSLFQIKLP